METREQRESEFIAALADSAEALRRGRIAGGMFADNDAARYWLDRYTDAQNRIAAIAIECIPC